MPRRTSPLEQRGARQQFLTPEEERARAQLSQRLHKAKLPQRIRQRQLAVGPTPELSFFEKINRAVTGPPRFAEGPLPPGGVFAGVAPGIGPGKGFSAARRLLTNVLGNKSKFLQKIARLTEGKAAREVNKLKSAILAVEKEAVKTGAKGATGVARQQAATLRKEVKVATTVLDDATKVKAGGPLPKGVRDPRVAPAKPSAPAKPEVTGRLPADQPTATPAAPLPFSRRTSPTLAGKILKGPARLASRNKLLTAIAVETGVSLSTDVTEEEGAGLSLLSGIFPKTIGLAKRGLRAVAPGLVGAPPEEIKGALVKRELKERQTIQRQARTILRRVQGREALEGAKKSLIERSVILSTRLEDRLRDRANQRAIERVMKQQRQRGTVSPSAALIDKKRPLTLSEVINPSDTESQAEVDAFLAMGRLNQTTDEDLQTLLEAAE